MTERREEHIMERYTYRGAAWLVMWGARAGGIAVGLLAILMIALMVANALPASVEGLAGVCCFAVWVLFVGCYSGLFLANLMPTIWLSENHLTVYTIPLGRVRVAWSDVVRIVEPWYALGFAVVVVRDLTPLHYVYSLTFAPSPYPAFMIGPGMERRKELLAEIRRRAQGAHSPPADAEAGV